MKLRANPPRLPKNPDSAKKDKFIVMVKEYLSILVNFENLEENKKIG